MAVFQADFAGRQIHGRHFTILEIHPESFKVFRHIEDRMIPDDTATDKIRQDGQKIKGPLGVNENDAPAPQSFAVPGENPDRLQTGESGPDDDNISHRTSPFCLETFWAAESRPPEPFLDSRMKTG
jgi:hypothetical protein